MTRSTGAQEAEQAGKAAFAQHAMVAAANPHAVEAGLAVIRDGGSAIDAAVAVQAMLGLVEPQSSGLGGGSFMVYYDAATHEVTAYDGREMAPAGAGPSLLLDSDGKPMPFAQAALSGKAVGVPGAMVMLAKAQGEHGAKPWAALFGDAERLADEGFVVSKRLGAAFDGPDPQARSPDVVAYFTEPDGRRVQAGDRLVNHAYAQTLRRLAAEGPSALLGGAIAADIVRRVHEEPQPGTLSLEDMAAYSPHEAPALCRPYRTFLVCTSDSPSGGPGLLEGLGLLERTDIAARGPDDPQAWYEFAQASRLMYADRNQYVGDPAFVHVPTAGLLDPAYLSMRAGSIGEHAGPAPRAGNPRGGDSRDPDRTDERGGTTHMVIVDAKGDALSMTTTINKIFGSGRMVDGFFLNDQLTDFSFSPSESDGVAAANAVAPHKRPRSSMSPVIVLDRKGRLVTAVGSPGGAAILAYNLKALIALLDWKLPVEKALALPNLIAQDDRYAGEVDKFAPGVLSGLEALGVKVVSPGAAEESGLHAIVARDGGLEGGADPRREGVAIGY